MELQQKPATDQRLVSAINKIGDITEYQDASVISRAVIKKPAGSITFFAFDKGEGLSEHTAPFDAFVSVIEGKVEIIISGKAYILEKDDVIIMPANEPHALKALEKFKMLLVMIKD
jgi:quercetin dioxygenase-like cupin family protein